MSKLKPWMVDFLRTEAGEVPAGFPTVEKTYETIAAAIEAELESKDREAMERLQYWTEVGGDPYVALELFEGAWSLVVTDRDTSVTLFDRDGCGSPADAILGKEPGDE